VTARGIEPRNPDPVASFTIVTPDPNGSDQTDGLMARNEREGRLHQSIAVGRMEIGVAYSAGLSFQQNLACCGRRNVPLQKL
jgi:hypothetical protein